jgi:two-component system cell cycle response regulator DivK
MLSVAAPLVLVVDDQAEVRDLFAGFLRRAGADVDEAADGLEAIDRLRLRVPDAVVCDLDMPNMDGVAFCQALRADASTHTVPILIVSGGGRLSLTQALDAGCTAVLAKPCSGAALVAAVDRLLDRAPAAAIAFARTTSPLSQPS